MYPIPIVHHVQKVEVLNVEPSLDATKGLYMKYWEDDNDTWLSRFPSGARLRITYTGGEPQELTIAEAKARSLVWYNPNPTADGSTLMSPEALDAYDSFTRFAVYGVSETAQKNLDKKYIKNVAWDKLPINPDDPWDKDKDFLKIRLNYRGAYVDVPVDIVYSLQTFQVNPTGEEEYVTMDMGWKRMRLDNDLGPSGTPEDESVLASRVNVKATFGTLRNNTWELNTLKPASMPANLTAAKQGVMPNGSSTNYTTDFGDYGKFEQIDPLEPIWTDRWKFVNGDWGVSGVLKNNGKQKAVTFYYKPPVVPAPYISTGNLGKISTKTLKDSVLVLWNNVGYLED